jgi:hypothetical protein
MEETGSTGELIRLFLALSFNELSTQKANTSMYFVQASFAKERGFKVQNWPHILLEINA